MLRFTVRLLAVAATAAPDPMRLALDRGDLWDLRPHPAFVRRGFTYQTVIGYATTGRTAELNREYARVSDFPTKLPGARLVLTIDPRYQARAFALDLRQALATVDLGSAELRCFFSATEPAGLLFVPGPAPSLSLVANQAVQGLGYTAPDEGRDGTAVWLVQDAALGFRYAIFAMARPVAGGTLVARVITTSGDDADPLALARRRAAHALDQGFDAAFAAHRRWWAAFWQRSSVHLPDAEVLFHCNLTQYFDGAASRSGAPPTPLQGVWTADEGKLPPWHGDCLDVMDVQSMFD